MKEFPIDDIMYCPHDDSDDCICRKPKPGMLIQASKKWKINLGIYFMIGDIWKDIKAGVNVGCKTILIDMPYNQGVTSDYRIRNLNGKGAVDIIKE